MFTLIVCSVNRHDRLARLFASLQQQTFRTFEVILVDQNLDDRLVPIVAEHVSHFPIRHVRSPKGLSLARNRGIAVAKSPLVAFPDDDCWYRPDTLETVASLFSSHPEIGIATGRTVDEHGVPSVSPTGETEMAVTRDNYLTSGNSNGIFLRRQVLETIGGLDERLGVGAATPFQSGEEADLLLRAIAAGTRVTFFPSILVHHDQVDQVVTPAHFERALKYGRGFGALLKKHEFGLPELAYRVFRPLARVLLSLATGKRVDAQYKWAWLRGIVEGYARWNRISAGLPHTTVPAPAQPHLTGETAVISS